MDLRVSGISKDGVDWSSKEERLQKYLQNNRVSEFKVSLVPNKPWFRSPDRQQSQSTDASCGGGKCSVYLQGTKQGEWATNTQKTRTPSGYQAKDF